MSQRESLKPKSTKRKGGRPTLDSAVAIRERLLSTALDAFLANGFGAASINSIAAQAKISRDTVYRQYSGKKELFLAATEFAFDAMAQHLHAVIELNAPPEQVLEKVVRYIYEDTRDSYSNSVIRLAIMEAYRFPEIAPDMLACSYQFVEPLARYLDHHRALGHLRFDNAHETALLIANLASGGGQFYVSSIQNQGRDNDAWVQQILQLVLFGLKGDGAGPASAG